jgi:GH25 family lysozyme M1 (1,4-beta-N-acetylmuramidase)
MSSATRRFRRRRGLALAGSALLGVVPALVAMESTGVPVAHAATQARGIDVSNYQHPGGAAIDWPQVRASGVEFAFIKATEGPVSCTGSYYTNNWLRRDWADAAAAGVYRGAYHFARPGDVGSAITQARYFVNSVGPMNGPRDLPPVLDLETTCGLGAPELAAFAHAWVDEVTRLTGRTPIIYSGYYFWKDNMRNDPSFAHLPFWIATYGPRPMVPPVWSGYAFWQYTSSASVPGIAGNVDMNWFMTGSDGLARMTVEGASNPHGSLDLAAGGRGTITVGGWALDPDAAASLNVHVYVDGVAQRAAYADGDRPDVGAAYPGAGAAHGFTTEVPNISGGAHQVCVWAINIGPGTNAVIGCSTVNVVSAQPFGALDRVAGGFGSIELAGWAVDPDTPAAVPIHVYVDGVGRANTPADASRPDVSAAIAGVGPAHGFSISIPDVAAGNRTVCAYAINIAGQGTNEPLGCRTVWVNGGAPIGALSSVSAGPGSIRMTGWAIDPDTAASIPVHLYVDGVSHPGLADVERPGLDAMFTGFGSRHGYDMTLAGLAAGDHRVCAYGINVAGPQDNAFLACRDVHVFAGDPLGVVDSIVPLPARTGADGSVTAQGWTIDPDTTAATDVHVYVDGRYRSAAPADRARPDLLASAVGGYGAGHGYTATVSGVTRGAHSVCVYALNGAGAGTNPLLACRVVTVN